MTNNTHLRPKDLIAYLSSELEGKLQGIIFDCDGVLVDSFEANMRYYDLIRSKFGLPPLNADQRRFCQMSSSQQAFEHIIPAPLRPALPQLLKEISYKGEIEPSIEAMKNIHAFLKRFQPHLLLGVHTNRMNGVDTLLQRIGIYEFFGPIMTVERAEPKPSPDGTLKILDLWNVPAKSVLFIGDSSTDQKTAAAAGTVFLSFENPELLPIGTCMSFDDLSEALATMLEID